MTGSGILARKSNVIGSVWIAIRKKCVHDRFGRKSKKHVIGSDFSKLIGRADYVLGFPTPAQKYSFYLEYYDFLDCFKYQPGSTGKLCKET
jgi:hypothetical protein